MKFLCPACERLTAFSGFRADGDVLVLLCSRCGIESRSNPVPQNGAAAVASSQSAVPGVGLEIGLSPPSRSSSARSAVALEDVWAIPEGHCPKCVAPRPADATSCAQCGLHFASFKPDELRPAPALEEPMQRLLSSWEDVAAHDRMIQAALVQGELATVGRMYRIRLARAPQDAYAARGRDEVLRLATASSTSFAEAAPVSEAPSPGTWKYLLLIAIMAVFAVAFFFLYRQFRTVAG
jgi:hypothetical protein